MRDSSVTGVQTCALPIAGGESEQPQQEPQQGNSLPRWQRRAPVRGSRRRTPILALLPRSEERRVGQEGRSRRSPYHYKKKHVACNVMEARGKNNTVRHTI